MNGEHRGLQLAVVVPLVGLLVMIARAEVLLRSGASFRLAIEGYDPRDLLAGQYLQYRFALDWQGESTCGVRKGRKASGVPGDGATRVTADGGVNVGAAGDTAEIAADEVITDGVPVLEAHCCVCLSSDVDSNTLAEARQVPCAEVESCAGWLRSSTLMPPLRYFVPERQAPNLEEALRGRQASIQVTCGPNGQPAIGDLYLDGRPWRDVIQD